MREPLVLDQTALATFEICPRRFQLRYLERLPWPTSPLDPRQSQAVERGRQFHRLVERHFLNLPVEEEAIGDDVVRDWWGRFKRGGPAVPGGYRWPEHRLTIPIRRSFLVGRFDLLVMGEEEGRPFAHLYDWKTGKPRSTAELEQEWQTRLYLALLAESGAALSPADRPLRTANISLTYWYPGEPDQPLTIVYSDAKHRQSWSRIQALVEAIEAMNPDETWPLTDDLSRCRSCLYQTYCGRQGAGASMPDVGVSIVAEEPAPYEADQVMLLEPQTP